MRTASNYTWISIEKSHRFDLNSFLLNRQTCFPCPIGRSMFVDVNWNIMCLSSTHSSDHPAHQLYATPKAQFRMDVCEDDCGGEEREAILWNVVAWSTICQSNRQRQGTYPSFRIKQMRFRMRFGITFNMQTTAVPVTICEFKEVPRRRSKRSSRSSPLPERKSKDFLFAVLLTYTRRTSSYRGSIPSSLKYQEECYWASKCNSQLNGRRY